jgi:hypothetical protein
VHHNQTKIAFQNIFLILDKHFLNLMWNAFVEFSILNDKTWYFVTFLCNFIKRSMIYVFRVKSNTFKAFKHFQQYNEHENNRIQSLRIDWKKEYSNKKFDDYRFKHNSQWKLIVSRISKQNEIVEHLKRIFLLMINIMFKNVDLNDKSWIELIKTISYFWNRFLIINKTMILYKIDIKKIVSRSFASNWNENQSRNKKNLHLNLFLSFS